MRQRNTLRQESTPIANGIGGFAARLRFFDIYRKVPRDLTEATAAGGSFSVLFFLFFVLLIFFETRNFVSVWHITSIKLDQSDDELLQVNLNLTLFNIDCDYLAVDLENVIGKKREDINDKTVHKYSLDGTFQGFADSDMSSSDLEHLYEGEEFDHYGYTRHAIQLDEKSFPDMLNRFEVLLVDFHAPWCIFCKQLAPEFEAAAKYVHERASTQFDKHQKHSVALASIDCTAGNNLKLCKDNHVQGYPTILVFRQNANNVITGPFGKFYEQYRGPRVAENIAKFALSVLSEVQKKDVDSIPLPHSGHDIDKDGILESKVAAKGCRIDGHLMVQRVPGQIIIRPKSKQVSFDIGLFSADHLFTHLSFGKPELSQKNLLAMDGAMHDVTDDELGKATLLRKGKQGVEYKSEGPNATYCHYIKVVSTTFVPLKGPSLHAYDYTINSNTYNTVDQPPHVAISYDLNPLKIVIQENTKPWIEGLTSIAAILGGVYTCSVLFESIFSAMVVALTKKDE